MVPKPPLESPVWLLCALGAELFFGSSFGFNPGWANGWPLGLTFYVVWSAGMSALFFLIAMTVLALVGTAVRAAVSCFGVRPGPGFSKRWLLASLILTIVSTTWVFFELYASARAEFPGGYNP